MTKKKLVTEVLEGELRRQRKLAMNKFSAKVPERRTKGSEGAPRKNG